jgi:hypothetical protein
VIRIDGQELSVTSSVIDDITQYSADHAAVCPHQIGKGGGFIDGEMMVPAPKSTKPARPQLGSGHTESRQHPLLCLHLSEPDVPFERWWTWWWISRHEMGFDKYAQFLGDTGMRCQLGANVFGNYLVCLLVLADSCAFGLPFGLQRW